MCGLKYTRTAQQQLCAIKLFQTRSSSRWVISNGPDNDHEPRQREMSFGSYTNKRRLRATGLTSDQLREGEEERTDAKTHWCIYLLADNGKTPHWADGGNDEFTVFLILEAPGFDGIYEKFLFRFVRLVVSKRNERTYYFRRQRARKKSFRRAMHDIFRSQPRLTDTFLTRLLVDCFAGSIFDCLFYAFG